MKYAFDFFGTLDTHEWVRVEARRLHGAGHEIHVVSAISPGLPMDNDEAYAEMLKALAVPFTAIHRVDHDPKLKVAVLTRLGVRAFWDDLPANVEAACAVGINAYLVGAAVPQSIQQGKACPVCGGERFTQYKILWPSLVAGWGLTPSEEKTIERQQGVHCMGCGCNLRAMALGQALKAPLHLPRSITLLASISDVVSDGNEVLEVNEAGALAPILAKIPGHVRASWPAVDLRALPFPNASFDAVVHSDTLEHIPPEGGGIQTALCECLRVLKPGGALCFTVPTLHQKLTRSTAGRPPTYHGPDGEESLRVHTEFGADVWAYVLAAGFTRCEFTSIEWPAGLAITAWK